jgi:Mg2+-importing ATPase
VDIAREAADIILLEKSLMVLEEGVIEGRRTFANMLKYIKMTASSNFGNVFSVLVASAFLPFLPMLPLHLLIQNLLYDVSQVAIPFDNVDDEQIRNRSAGTRPISGALWSSLADQLHLRYSDLLPDVVGVPRQHAGTSDPVPVRLVRGRAAVADADCAYDPYAAHSVHPEPRRLAAVVMTLVVMAVGIALPFSPLASYLQLQALPLSYFPWLVAILAGYMVLTQMVKGFYSRRYGWQ